MYRTSAIRLCMLLLALPCWASAEELPPSGAPPSESEPMTPPPSMYPPPWIPPYVVPEPSPAEIDALEQAGRRKKRLGAILMGIGGGIAIAGTGMMIGGAWEGSCARRYDYRYGYYRYNGYYGSYVHCEDSALLVAGFTTALFGGAVIVPGAFIYSDGGREVATAHRLRRCYWSSVKLRPTIGRDIAGLEVTMRW